MKRLFCLLLAASLSCGVAMSEVLIDATNGNGSFDDDSIVTDAASGNTWHTKVAGAKYYINSDPSGSGYYNGWTLEGAYTLGGNNTIGVITYSHALNDGPAPDFVVFTNSSPISITSDSFVLMMNLNDTVDLSFKASTKASPDTFVPEATLTFDAGMTSEAVVPLTLNGTLAQVPEGETGAGQYMATYTASYTLTESHSTMALTIAVKNTARGVGCAIDDVTLETSGIVLPPATMALPLLDGITHYWPGDGFDGTILLDEAFSSNPRANGTPSGLNPPVAAPGKFGDAVDFPNNSVADGAIINLGQPDTLNRAGSFTISLWFNPDDTAPFGSGNYAGIMMRRNPSNDGIAQMAGNIDFRQNGQGERIATTWDTNAWYHAVITYDYDAQNVTGIRRVYLNNEMHEVSSSPLQPGTVDEKAWMLAKDSGISNRFWDGMIDEIVVWDRALTPSEVDVLYNNGEGFAMNQLIKKVNIDEGQSANVDLGLLPRLGGSVDSWPLDVSVVCLNDPNAIVAGDPDQQLTVSPNPVPFASIDASGQLTIEALDDILRQGDREFALKMVPVSDPNGVTVNPYIIKVVVGDDDFPEVLITGTDALDLAEGAVAGKPASAEYQIQLVTAPNPGATVRIDLDVDADYLQVEPTFVEFTQAATPATITVTVVDNSIVEDNVPYTEYSKLISYTVTSSGDAEYNGFAVEPTTVTIQENDCGAVGFDALDANEDCKIDLVDLQAMVAKWLTCYYPNRIPGECLETEMP